MKRDGIYLRCFAMSVERPLQPRPSFDLIYFSPAIVISLRNFLFLCTARLRDAKNTSTRNGFQATEDVLWITAVSFKQRRTFFRSQLKCIRFFSWLVEFYFLPRLQCSLLKIVCSCSESEYFFAASWFLIVTKNAGRINIYFILLFAMLSRRQTIVLNYARLVIETVACSFSNRGIK